MKELIENIQKDIKEAEVFKPAGSREVKKRLKDRIYRRYYFPIIISGMGYDMDKAWEDAVESFSTDPGGPDEDDVTAIRIDPETFDEIGDEEKVTQ